jgi:CDP-glycerol glycerophosphotransferase
VPRISVVVPIYNVERYLDECLRSVADQTVTDLEVVMVDDGSTDGSTAIAEAYARRDDRFRLVTQPNGGLSKARNTGTEHARGEFLVFLDSDDVLPLNAYELLLGALDQTGSDFATGNVHRLSRWGTTPALFLARAFAETRLKTHVTRNRTLLADRTAWNKLWRRSFWDRHGFRFPEGRLYEDSPVTLPAHFAAASVDVIADPVYYWRVREGVDRSITQRRLETRVLLDRLAAVQEVSDHLARSGPRRAKRWYDASVVADDLRLHLNVLDGADEEYRELFMDRVNAFLDGASPRIYDDLRAIDRLKWHLVRRRLVPELLEVLRFESEDMGGTPPLRIGRRWYGDYPFFGDRRLKIPRSVYRLRGDFGFTVRLEELSGEGGKLRVKGFAYISGIGAPRADSQRVQMSALRPGRLRRVRLLTSAVRFATTSVHRPDVTAQMSQAQCDISWSGFEAVLDPADLRAPRGSAAATWEVFLTVRAGGVKRRRARFAVELPRPLSAVELPAAGATRMTASLTADDALVVEARDAWAMVRSHRVDGDVLELSGEARLPPGADPKLRLRPESGGPLRRYPMVVEGGTFTARVPLADLRGGGGEPVWTLSAGVGKGPIAVLLPEEPTGAAWPSGDREVALIRTRQGHAALVDRRPRPVMTDVRWRDDGTLELAGSGAPERLLLVDPDRGLQRAIGVAGSEGPGRFTARFEPARMPVAGGPLPLQEGDWQLHARLAGDDDGDDASVPVLIDRALAGRLPLATVLERKPFAVAATEDGVAVLEVRRDLDEDERGGYQQRGLRENAYAGRRTEPLRDAVLYMSFGGRQYADSPRAIHEELSRRGAPLEHLWVVRDGQCRVPETATVVRDASREFHEALARSRYVVTNDRFPTWFARRPDQVCLHTWHGTPLMRRRPDFSGTRTPRAERQWARQVPNWQYVLAQNRFSAQVLQQAWAIEGEILETGHPRVDRLARPDRDALADRVRARLDLPDGMRTVLYAPKYRDDLVDRQGQYRLDLRLDLERLRRAAGDDTLILFRKHPYVTGTAPLSSDPLVRDVSTYPDGTELLLATDVLITDYSSMMVDFANTGRPMLFYTYDLDAYDQEVPGFHLDFEATVPGPLLRTADEVADALRDVDRLRARYEERYAAFRKTFCELDDGRAAERVVDRLFSS